MKQFILTMLIAFLCISTFAQKGANSPKKERTISLWGHIKDSFTKVGIKDVKITLMTTDSTVVDTCTAWRVSYKSNDFGYRFDIPAKPCLYIIRATHPDYYDTYVNYEVQYLARNRYFDAPWHYMKRRSSVSSDFEGGALGEVTVKATRVKIAYKGDTIVYDASAFKLPDGSMLDALVRQLPGAELKDDGSILVNGRKIDYLTLNGKDFFKGQNKIMLENLPYFTVKDIKVYNRTTDFSKYMGKDVEQKDYVMDVNLKKEYATGYLGNVETGVASSNRYMGRLFASRFSDHTKISVFGNLNNINETRNPENNGDWRPTDAPVGKTTNRSVGLNIQSDGKDKSYTNSFDMNANWNDYLNGNSRQGANFMANNNSFSLSDNQRNTRNRQFSLSNNFKLQLPVWIESNTQFRINDTDSRSLSRSATSSADITRYGDAPQALDSVFAKVQPVGIRESLLNRTYNDALFHGTQLYVYQKLFVNKKLPWGDNLEIEVNGNYNKRENKSYSDYRLNYMDKNMQDDNRNIYTNSPTKYYRWEGRAEYYINALNNWTYRIYTLYNQENQSRKEDYYRLDQFTNWTNGMQPLGDIPSTADSLLMVRSLENSKYTNRMTRNWQSGLHFYYSKQTDSTYTWIRFHLPIYVRNERIGYQHNLTDTCATRKKVFIDGNINSTFAWKSWKRVVNIDFWHNTLLPDLSEQVNFDYSNPLSITLANPNLKTGHSWKVSARYQHRLNSNRMNFSINPEFTYQSNPVIMGYSYNRKTGVYTYQSQNADYGWQGHLGLSFSGAIDKKQLWTFSLGEYMNWNKNQMMEMPADGDMTQLYDVLQGNYRTQANLYYRKHSFSTGVDALFIYANTHYQQGARENYNGTYTTLTYSVNYMIPVLDINVASSFAWTQSASSLSYAPTQNYYIWHASLSRSFLKGKKLTAKLTAFDLLNSVSHVSYSYTANSFRMNMDDRIGRYVMFSLAYKVNVNPKKK